MKMSKLAILAGSLLLCNLSYAEYTCAELTLKDCPQPIDKKLPDPHDMLSWTPEQRVIGFRNTFRSYDGSVFRTNKDNILPLPRSPRYLKDKEIVYSLDNKTYNLNDYLKKQNVTGLIVLKDGKIAYEYYGKGNTPTTLWTSRSVAKSIVATLIGVAIQQGKIHSLDDPIIQYLPDLKNTAWEKVSLRQLMQHTSGVEWSENYKDPQSDFAKMTYCEVAKDPDACVYTNVKNVKAKFEPGTVWSYNTGGAFLVGKVLEAATHENIARYLQDNVWQKVGMEREGIWQSYQRNKTDMGGHGFNATLRDYARFAQFVAKEGQLANGEKILPDGWTQASTDWTKAKNSVSKNYPEGIYGFQWWNSNAKAGSPLKIEHSDSTFWGLGIFGQLMAINPVDDVVMVQWSAWDVATPSESMDNVRIVLFNAINNVLNQHP